MKKEEIFEVMKKNILEIVDSVNENTITPDISLRALNTNSIDRAEIIMMTMQDLQVKAPMIDFAEAENIKDICLIFEQKLQHR